MTPFKLSFVTSLLFVNTIVYGNDELVDYIPFKIQTEYGLDQLSLIQKETLAKWLKDAGVTSKSHGKTITSNLSMSLYGGQYISLEDNSYWKIFPEHVALTKEWITAVPIKVHLAEDVVIDPSQKKNAKLFNDYPYTLYNTVTKQVVRGSKTTKKEVFEKQ